MKPDLPKYLFEDQDHYEYYNRQSRWDSGLIAGWCIIGFIVVIILALIF